MGTLAEKIKGKNLFTLNSKNYFGSIEEVEGKVTVTEAVNVAEGEDFGDTVKNWVMANNMGKLKAPKVSGIFTWEEEELNEDQLITIDVVISRAEQIIKNALPGYQNDQIKNIVTA